ncbi:MAG: hypothetical protein GKR92_02140 [Gammaproteobacteria bacterium]|nr:MAG: hypothetical protein GKR92_02140 [Gammaproteobacteria bacterium]
MNYTDGKEVIVGDKVRLGDDDGGIVVCSIDRDEYKINHPKDKWKYLEKGVLIEFPKFGLIHYEESEEDLSLIKRSE